MAKKKVKINKTDLHGAVQDWTVALVQGNLTKGTKNDVAINPTYPIQLFVRATRSAANPGESIFTAAGNPGDLRIHNRRKAVAVYEYKGMVTVANKTTLIAARKPKKKRAKKGRR